MAKNEDSLIVKIAGKLDPSLASAVSGAQKLINGASGAAQKVAGFGLKVAGIATQAVAATGTAITAGAGAAIKTAGDFDSAMSQVAASMGTTVDKIPDIEKMAKKMGAETSFSAVEAAQGFNILAQAGLSAQDQISAIKPVLDLAAAGGIDMADSASYVTGAVMGFGDSMSNANKYADMIALGATQVKTDVGSLGEAFSDASSVAKSFSQDQTTTIVTLERLANANVTGSEAANSMRRVLTRLYAPTSTASKALKKLGVSAYDANGDARDLTDVIDDLQAATDKLPESQKNAYLNTILGQQGLTAYSAITATTTDKVEELYKAMGHASDGAGSAANQAATMLDNLNGDITIMKSALEGVSIAFGQQLTPYAREAVQWATNALSGITEIMNGDASVADKISQVAGEVGSLGAEVVTAVTKKIPDIVSLAGKVIEAFFKGIRDNLPEISQAAADTITYLVTGVANHLPEVTEFTIQMIETIVNAFTQNGNLQKITQALAGGITQMINIIIQHLPEFLQMGKQIFTQIIDGIKQGSSGSAGGVINKIFLGLLAVGPIEKAIKPILGTIGTISSMFGKLPGVLGKFGSAAEKVTAPAQAASGGLATLAANAKGIVALGAGILMSAAGIALLAQAAVQVASAGPGAALAMVGMVAAIAALAAGAAAVAPALAAGAAGLLAFGGAVAITAAGCWIMVQAATQLASAGAPAAIAMEAMAVGTVALGAAAGALSPLLIAGAAGLAAVGASLVVVGAGFTVISAAAVVASVALRGMAAALPVLVAYGSSGSAAMATLGAAVLALGASAAGGGRRSSCARGGHGGDSGISGGDRRIRISSIGSTDRDCIGISVRNCIGNGRSGRSRSTCSIPDSSHCISNSSGGRSGGHGSGRYCSSGRDRSISRSDGTACRHDGAYGRSGSGRICGTDGDRRINDTAGGKISGGRSTLRGGVSCIGGRDHSGCRINDSACGGDRSCGRRSCTACGGNGTYGGISHRNLCRSNGGRSSADINGGRSSWNSGKDGSNSGRSSSTCGASDSPRSIGGSGRSSGSTCGGRLHSHGTCNGGRIGIGRPRGRRRRASRSVGDSFIRSGICSGCGAYSGGSRHDGYGNGGSCGRGRNHCNDDSDGRRSSDGRHHGRSAPCPGRYDCSKCGCNGPPGGTAPCRNGINGVNCG